MVEARLSGGTTVPGGNKLERRRRFNAKKSAIAGD
jgi:hypothetical protein